MQSSLFTKLIQCDWEWECLMQSPTTDEQNYAWWIMQRVASSMSIEYPGITLAIFDTSRSNQPTQLNDILG